MNNFALFTLYNSFSFILLHPVAVRTAFTLYSHAYFNFSYVFGVMCVCNVLCARAISGVQRKPSFASQCICRRNICNKNKFAKHSTCLGTAC